MNQLTSEQVSELTGISNPFSANIPTSHKAEKFGEIIKEQLAEQATIQQKELELQQQKETLQKAAEIEEKLKAAQENLSNSPMS